MPPLAFSTSRSLIQGNQEPSVLGFVEKIISCAAVRDNFHSGVV